MPGGLELLEDDAELYRGVSKTSRLLQDGAPCHSAIMVTKWLTQRPNITLIKWLVNGTTLNPIKNCVELDEVPVPAHQPQLQHMEEGGRLVDNQANQAGDHQDRQL